MNKLSIRDLDMKGKRVFLRVDFNVPLDSMRVADDMRMRRALPTIQLARNAGARMCLPTSMVTGSVRELLGV